MLRALANWAIHPSGVGKWVVIHVIGYNHGLRGKGLAWLIGVYSMPAGSITTGPKSVTRAMGAASLRRGTIASANQPPLPRLWKRRWYVLRLLSGAIPSTIVPGFTFLPLRTRYGDWVAGVNYASIDSRAPLVWSLFSCIVELALHLSSSLVYRPPSSFSLKMANRSACITYSSCF